MSQPAIQPPKRERRRVELSEQELALLPEGPLSVEDSRRMSEYLEGDATDLEGPVSLDGLLHSVGLMMQPEGPDGVVAAMPACAFGSGTCVAATHHFR